MPAGGEGHDTAGLVALQVDRAEAVAAEQHRPHQGAARTGAAVADQVLDDLGHHRAVGVVVLGGVGVEHQPELHAVVVLLHPREPALVQAHGVHGPGRRGIRHALLALGADGGGRAVALTGEADPVVAVADLFLERRVDAAGEEVVVDHPVALRERTPGLEVDGGGVVLVVDAAAVVARAGLELQRGGRLPGTVHRRHEGVDDVEVGGRVEGHVAHVVVRARHHAGHARVGLDELADPDRERLTAAALGAVDVDEERARPRRPGPRPSRAAPRRSDGSGRA